MSIRLADIAERDGGTGSDKIAGQTTIPTLQEPKYQHARKRYPHHGFFSRSGIAAGNVNCGQVLGIITD